jgi:hypothetical protein
MGLLKFFGGLFGFIEGAFIIVVAGFGWWGSFFNHKRAMFLVSCAPLLVDWLTCVYYFFVQRTNNGRTIVCKRLSAITHSSSLQWQHYSSQSVYTLASN